MPEPDKAPSHPSRADDREAEKPGADPAPAEELRARVQRQRRHIEELTGQDPLRGGVDD